MWGYFHKSCTFKHILRQIMIRHISAVESFVKARLARGLPVSSKCLTTFFSVLERTTVRLSDAGATKWPSTSLSCQTWSLPAVLWPGNLTSWPSCVWLSPIWNLWGVLATHPLMEPISLPFSLNRYCNQKTRAVLQMALSDLNRMLHFLVYSYYTSTL